MGALASDLGASTIFLITSPNRFRERMPLQF